MTTLHIEHRISDFDTWRGAFDRFAGARRAAGVRGHRVLRPVDDDTYVVIDLDFATPDEATAFLGFLRSEVWQKPESSPALVGAPRAMVLESALTATPADVG